MKKRQIFSALFLLTTVFTANGITLEVEFTKNLTNETEWVYTKNTRTTVDGKLYISSKDGIAVMSPLFDFAITSVTVVAYHSTDNPGRRLFAVPFLGDNGSEDPNDKRELTPQNRKEQDTVVCSWDRNKHVQSIGFQMEEGSSGNIYLLSAKILGVSIPYPPENLEAARVGGKQIFIKWRNSETVAGNKVRVYKTTWCDESFETIKSYDFNAEGFQNKGNNDEITANLLIESYPDFAGSTLIYLPTNSVGQIQISNNKNRGVLKHKGFQDYGSLHVDMTVKRYFNSASNEQETETMTVGYEYPAGTTNVFATVNLEKNFKREIIPLNGFRANTPILFNASGNKTNHRVIIDEMKFIKNYSPAGERLDLVQETNTSGSRIRLSNLERNTDYVIRVAAADANGKESESAELRVKTSSQNDSGFYLKVR